MSMKSRAILVSLVCCFVLSSGAAAQVGAEERGVAVHLVSAVSSRERVLAHAVLNALKEGLLKGGRLRLLESAPVEAAIESIGLADAKAISVAEAVKLGEALGASGVVVGTLSGVFELRVALWDPASASALGEDTETAGSAGVFDMVDAASERIADRIADMRKTETTVAVLPFSNLASADYDLFVRGMADIVMSNLRQTEGIGVVERAEIDRHVADLDLVGQTPPAMADAVVPELTEAEVALVSLGRRVGADVAVMGVFRQLYQLEVTSVDVGRREALAEHSYSGQREDLPARSAELGNDLLASLARFHKRTRKVAVLSIANHSSEQYARFVRGMSDMLMTSLGQSDKLTLIERIQIDEAMENLSLELSGPVDAATAAEVGKWLGADAVVLGGFTTFGDEFRIDARMIDAETGEQLIAQNVRGKESDVIAMVDELGGKLAASFDEKQAEIKGGAGSLRVRFMVTRAEMTERSVYFQVCRIYIDDKEVGLSPVIDKSEEWMTLLARDLAAGTHTVSVLHGFVKEDGSWDGELSQQPRVFRVSVEPDATTTVQYSYGVGWFSDDYYYEPPWRARK